MAAYDRLQRTKAIVLLDLVERLRTEGMSTREALIRGGHKRVRPILMTASPRSWPSSRWPRA